MIDYVRRSPTLVLFPVFDDQHHTYTVLAITRPLRPHQKTTIVLFARYVADTIVIEHDATDKPLVEALTAAGVPRDHIVLAYAGETRPDAEQLAANWPPENTQG